MPDEVTVAKQRDLHWEAETLRLTALYPSGDVGRASDHWSRVVGEEPESSSTQKGGETRAEGPYAECRLSLIVRPERIDWIVSPHLSPEPSDWPGATTGKPVSAAFAIIEEVARAWAGWDGCPSCLRVAVGAVLLAQAESREAGYEGLAAYLPGVKLDPQSSRDFSYQINRPARADSLESAPLVNRLCKWSVASFVITTVAIGPRGMRSLPGNTAFACRLELDVNTDAEFEGEINREQLPALVEQLCNYAKEIAREGDQP